MAKIKIKCKCGKIFEAKPSNNRTYCSRGCYVKYRSTHSKQFKKGQTPWNKGKTGLQVSYRKGRTWDSIWGEEKSKKMKENFRKKVYKGTMHLNRMGYYRMRSPTNGKLILVHQKVWKENNGLSYIPSGCCVHHLDGNKINNNPNNLLLLDVGTHSTLHHTGMKYSDESRKKMSTSGKKKIFTKEHRDKINTALRNRRKK